MSWMGYVVISLFVLMIGFILWMGFLILKDEKRRK